MAFTPELLYGSPLLKEEEKRVKRPRPAMENTQAVQAEVAKIARKNTPSAELRQDMQRKKEERADSEVAVEPLKIQKDAKAKAEDRLKTHEDTDIDWTDAAARQKHEQEQAHRQAAVDQAGKALAKAESEQGVKFAQDSLGALSPEEDAALNAYIMERENHHLSTINPMMDNPFGPLYSEQTRALLDKYGKTAVDAMASVRSREDTAEVTKAMEDYGREQAEKGGLHAAAASLLTIPAQAMASPAFYIDAAVNAANGRNPVGGIDPNFMGNVLNRYTDSVRGTVAKGLAEKGLAGKAGSWLYQAAMSVFDNAERALYGPVGGAVLAATQSFSRTLSDATEQGATPAQAALLATTNAGIEYLTEKIPLDDLISVAKGTNAGAIIKNLLRNAGIEAAMEELSLLGTVLAEAAILRENSAYQQEIQGMIDGGMSLEEAKEEANRGFIDEAINTMIVSGLAGGVGGLGASVRGQQVQADADYQAMQQAQEAETESPAQSAGQEEVSVQEAVQSPAEAVPGPVEAMAAAVVQNRPQMEQVQQNPSEDLVNRAVAGMFEKSSGNEQGYGVTVKSAGTALTELNKEKNTLAYTLASNLDAVRDMEPVSQLTGKEFNDRSKKIPEQIRDFFKSLGNKVVRAGFGDIILGEYGVGGMMNHRPLNRSKMVSLAAVPNVVKTGRQIAYDSNWKGRGYESFTFAAPVTVNGTEVYVAAVVNRKPDNKFYLSEMVDSQGNYVRIEESPSGNSEYGVTDGAENSGRAGKPMGPEGLSEEGNPSANAEPTPLPTDIVPRPAQEVKENPAQESDYYDEFEDWGADPNREGVGNPLADRNFSEVGKRSTKAYMYENPAVKPFYQEQAARMLSELADSTKGERTYNEQVYYESGGEKGWSGTKRHTSESIAELLDQYGMTYEQIERGLNAIINDSGQENNAASKRIEFVINDRLMNGYTDFYSGERVPGNTEYLNLLRNQQQAEDSGQPIPEGMKGTGAAEQDFSGKAAYADLLREGNVQRDRPGDVRPVEVPKKDGNGRRVTEFAGNAYGSAYTPDYMANEIGTLIQDGKMGFDTRSNQESLRRAAEALEQNTEGVKAKIAENLAKNRIQDGDIEKALLLYVKDANSKEKADQEAAAQLLVQLGQMANISGRNLQLFSMLRRMTPEGKLMYAKKTINQEIARLNKGRSKKKQIAEPEIPPALQKDYLNAKTEEETQAALDAIYMDVASKIKPTLGEMWDAWRNMAMLMNPKTHIRNIGATGAFQPFVQVKRMIGTGLEKALLDKGQRTKSVLGADSRSQTLLAWAKEDAEKPNIIERMGQTYATGNEARSKIQEYRKIFPGFADKVRKGNMDIMEREDRFFKKGVYARSLASFLKARGYTAQDLITGMVPAGILEEGRTLAIKEAQKATFNDRNAFSDTMAKLGRGVDKIPIIGKVVSKGALPFLRTPANVVARAWDYSPMKLAQTFYQVHQNSIDAATAIDQVSGALTGTAAMALGVALAAGIVPNVELVGKIEDEDEKENGAIEYSLRIGDKYYGVSWLAPAMIPPFIGANLHDKFQALGEENGMDGWDVAQAFMEVGADALDPMMELSMLSSLNDMIDAASEEDSAGGKAIALFLNAATSYFTQGLPTIFGQAEQALETEKSSTYVNTDNKVEKVIKKALGSASRRIPILDLFQTPRRDEFGQVVQNEGDALERAFNAFLNPFNVSQKKTDPINQELSRLRKAGAENASIPLPQRMVTYTDMDGEKHANVRLSQEQYDKLAQVQGQTEHDLLTALLDSSDFMAMGNDLKDAVLGTVHTYAKETSEIAAIKNHLGYSATWMEELAEAEDPAKYIVQRVAGSTLNRAMTDLDMAWGHGWNTKAKERALDAAYQEYKNMSRAAQKEIEDFATGTAKKYLEARGKGISHEDFLAAAKNVETVKGTGKYNADTGENSVRDIDKREAIAKTTGLSHQQIDIIMKAYMPDYDKTDEQPNKTELKYDYARKEMDMSAREYARTYRAYLDNEKKAEKIAAIQALGYDHATANRLYKLYAGRVDVVAWAGK